LSIIWERRNFSNPEICFENFRVGFSSFPSFVIDSSSNGVKMVVAKLLDADDCCRAAADRSMKFGFLFLF
jgi:hypothetical protein